MISFTFDDFPRSALTNGGAHTGGSTASAAHITPALD